MKYGDRLRMLRDHYGLGRKVFAEIIGTSREYIDHIENERKEFSKKRERDIRSKFRLPMDFFETDDPTLGDNLLTHDEILELLQTSIEDDELKIIKVSYEIVEEDKK
jgi:transcriptional regulator with XRE-family HTH domain